MSDTNHTSKASSEQALCDADVRELVCALMDGELAQEDVSLAVKHCENKDWAAYHLIGDVMRRSELLTPVSESFAVRMAAALEREPEHRLPRQSPVKANKQSPASGWKRWFAWPTVAVSAAVASVVWVAQPLFDQNQRPQVAYLEPASSPVSEAVLSDYTEAHRQLAGPITVQQASYTPGSGQ